MLSFVATLTINFSFVFCLSFIAVAAKAPRKTLAARSSMSSPSSVGKKKSTGGGNPIKMWPKPSWQKGLQAFLGGEGSDSSDSSSSANTSLTETDRLQECSGSSDSGVSTGQGSSAHCSSGLLDGDIAQLNSDTEDD